MYSVIIADDSKKICEGLQEILPKGRNDLEIIGVYYNGKALLEALKQGLPDILISDIRMPGADGLEICEYLRSRNADTQIILITAFQEFEYAKRAIDYKVSAFLIKPYSTSSLFEAFDSAISNLEEQRGYADALTDLYLTKRDDIKSKISAVYHGKAECQSIKDIPLMNQSVLSKNCFVLESEVLLEKNRMPYEKDLDFESPYLSCFTVETGRAVLFFKDKEYAENYFTDCVKEAAFSGNKIHIKNTAAMTFSQWENRCSLRKFSISFAESIKECQARNFISSAAHDIAFEFKDLAEIIKITANLLECDYIADDFTYSSEESVADILLQFAEFYLNTISTQSIAERIERYVMLNFNDSSLSVSKIAEHLSLNSDYISNNFKRETGKTITEFVTQTRIAQALKLLENRNISISDVASEVGFNDISYFNRVFKKYNSITPTQYQKKREQK